MTATNQPGNPALQLATATYIAGRAANADSACVEHNPLGAGAAIVDGIGSSAAVVAAAHRAAETAAVVASHRGAQTGIIRRPDASLTPNAESPDEHWTARRGRGKNSCHQHTQEATMPRPLVPPPELELTAVRRLAKQLAEVESEVDRICAERNQAMIVAKAAGATGDHLAETAGIARRNAMDIVKTTPGDTKPQVVAELDSHSNA
ncbi:hypothetical protein F0L68_11250 [Solihabitans fulvus]|uniref:Uncharacterized protein n=1 Tax=Solihabitans fulvus TaxID=1892852 RepID=A0A5B2XJF9_9PSEU|nr:hypothetical protein [Solihabitans fulvus]KAA2263021.1 hypothetical protein F0L68_11250 [Solihabitans fulvus]